MMAQRAFNQSTRHAVADIHLGLRVDRASATLPQTAAAAIFNIVGGRVAMTAILGEVTVVLGAVGNMSLESNPTVGTTAALSAVVAAGAFEAGTLLSITGMVANAMLGVDAGGTAMQTCPVALPVGTLDLRLSASSTGSVKWSIWYVPIDDGAYVTAA
jgi:hypothetical protein